MPTDEFRSLLDRDGAVRGAAPLIDLASPLLREITNKASWVFGRCTTEGSQIGAENEDLASLTLFRHIIELVDGIEVLLSRCCVNAAVPLLRAEFEALLSLDYIMRGDYARRSLSWSYVYIHSRMDQHRRLDPSTDVGRDFADAWRKDIGSTPVAQGSHEAVAALRSVLDREQFNSIEAEYKRVRKERRRRPDWFQLFDGPSDRRGLAKEVGYEPHYLALYRDWSGFSHAADASRYLTSGRVHGKGAFYAVRSPHNLQFQANITIGWLLRASRIMLGHFRPDENLGEWYQRDVKPRWDQLRGMKVDFVEHEPEEA